MDFGGYFTPGWVDINNEENVEEDLQGLSRIKKFLRLEVAVIDDFFNINESKG